jgi:hypothetical protein
MNLSNHSSLDKSINKISTMTNIVTLYLLVIKLTHSVLQDLDQQFDILLIYT